MELGLSFNELLAEQDRLLNAIVSAQEADNPDDMAMNQMILDEYIAPGLATKVDALAYVIQTKLPAQIEELKAYRKQIDAAIKARENGLENVKDYLKYQVKREMLPPTIVGSKHSINISDMTTPTVTVDSDPAEWGSEFDHLREVQVKYVAKKKPIAEHAAQGKSLPDGVTVSFGQRLSVKLKK